MTNTHRHEHNHPHDHKETPHPPVSEHKHVEGKGEHKVVAKGRHHHHEAMIEDYKRRFIVSTILTIPVLVLSPGIQEKLGYTISLPGSMYLLWALSTVIYAYGGKPFLVGLVEELRKRLPGMMTLIGVAISVAYFYSTAVTFFISGQTFYWELATLIDIMLLGHWIEMKSILGASRALEELVKALPTIAHLVRDGEVVDVHVSEVKRGDRILVKPGEKIPVDGVIVEGTTSIDESLVTGESRPVTKKPGDKVIAGTINLDGTIIVRAEGVGDQTYLAQIVELVKRIQESKSRMQDLANRAAKWLTVIALTAGASTFAVWVSAGYSAAFALERAVTVMVITCPHALGLAIPLVVARSSAILASNGILVRNRMAFEKAKDIQAVVFDKTGTLTKGELGVDSVVPLVDGYTVDEIAYLAASLEQYSEHPIAKAIVEYAEKNGIKLGKAEDFKALPGVGVEGVVDGRRVRVVSSSHLLEQGVEVSGEAKKLLEQGKTVVFLLVEDKPVGAIALSDVVREESREAIKTLKEMGIKTIMLTGDNRHVAASVAKELGIDEFYAEVLPHEKAEVVKKIKEKGYVTAMVGDGVNDAPALMEADVGIAIGAGTDIAIESADIILVKNDPRDVPKLIELSRKSYRKMRQNLFWAVGYNVFAIPAAAGALYKLGFLLPPALGALFMSASTVIVAVNATLLR